MDNTELHYVSYDPDELWQEMNIAYLEAGGDILYGGDEKEILLRSVLAIAVSILAKVDSALRMDTLTYAVRGFLDLYGEKRNCTRNQAKAATVPVRITFQATGTAKTYPADETYMTADGVMQYHLTSDISYTGNAETVDTTLKCNTAGAAGNSLIVGSHMQMLESDNAVVSIVALDNASGGVDEEDDEPYRERIRTNGLTSVTTGPSALYEAKAKAVSSQIVDARALNDGAGVVGIYLILASGASSETLIQAVEDALSPIDVRPLNDSVDVQLASTTAYTLHVSIWYPAGLDIGDAITEAIAEYKSWQENTVGRAFNPSKLTAALFQLGVTRVEYADDDGISGAGAKYTEIAARAHCVGTITPNVVVET